LPDTSIHAIIESLKINLRQLITPDVDSISADNLELISAICQQVVLQVEETIFCFKRFNFTIPQAPKRAVTQFFETMNKELFGNALGGIYPLYMLITELNQDVTDLELYFIVFSLSYHVSGELERRRNLVDDSSLNGVRFEEDDGSFTISGNEVIEDDQHLALKLRPISGSSKVSLSELFDDLF
jgi:hypothetical protein